MTTIDDRTDIVTGLRALLDFAEKNPHLAEDLGLTFDRLLVCVSHNQDPKASMAAFAKASGKAAKTYDDRWAGIDITFGGGVNLHVYASRELVCERVVTGTREVSKEIPDPEALAAVPKVTVTETVEDVEWICTPLLAVQPVTA